MLSVIKTAIITIIISFISGVLLDNYKNLAPKILCTMGKGIPLKFNNKKIKAYNLNIRNMSNKTIHDLNINIQGHYDKLRVEDAKITKGLKFKLSGEDNNYNVSIPFLSRNDEFSVKVFVADNLETSNKPIITLRSPENFKKVYSTNKNGYLASILNIPKDISDHFSSQKNSDKKTRNNKMNHNAEKGFFSNKKAIITIASILLISYFGILGGEYYMKTAAKVNNVAEKESVESIPETSSSTSSALNKDTQQKEISTSSNENTSNKQPSKNSEKSTTSSSNNKSTKVTNEESNQNEKPSNKDTQSNNSNSKSKESTNKNTQNNKDTQNNNNNNNKSEENNNSQNNKNNTNVNKSLNIANKNAKSSQNQNTDKSNQNAGNSNTPEQNKN